MSNVDVMNQSAQPIAFDSIGFADFDWDALWILAGRSTIAAVLGALVAFRWWRRWIDHSFEPIASGAQVLIACAGAMMIAVIQANLALAFALVGLGGFIRFRSGIKDPKEAGVMFLMLGIGMSAGGGKMPFAFATTGIGLVLLIVLDALEPRRRVFVKRRIRLGDIGEPHTLEPKIRAELAKFATIKGSKIRKKSEEIVIDLYGDGISDAGSVVELLAAAGIEISGDVSCEEI